MRVASCSWTLRRFSAFSACAFLPGVFASVLAFSDSRPMASYEGCLRLEIGSEA